MWGTNIKLKPKDTEGRVEGPARIYSKLPWELEGKMAER